MRAGRSRDSWMLVALDDLHAFAWAPFLGADSWGGMVRFRRGRAWRHYSVTLMRRNGSRRRRTTARAGRFAARPTLTLFELAHWRTVGGVRDRDGLKAYLRVKVGPGGRAL